MVNKRGDHYIGIDVGTGIARACVIDHEGNIVGLASQGIKTWHPHPEFYEQSTTNIWDSIRRSQASSSAMWFAIVQHPRSRIRCHLISYYFQQRHRQSSLRQ
ncbi:hypothetical protein F1880_004818 [Penicillium rolfsii]|nr:hypothetical protein F1880_004818 [Penicillium rolfsii]